jgi:signal transduction histidine kinase
MNQQEVDNLRSQLIEAVQAPAPDIQLIQKLTASLARLDLNNVRFTVDAGLISRLGQELVGKQETAVAELIKNAYDADATEVRIVFEESYEPGGTLLIEDDGSGMSREQLLDGFMRLSSNDKLIHPVSERFKRRRAGRKGIGRFAVQRLGETLVLTTQTQASDTALRVRVDWDDFQAGRELSSIASKVEYVLKERVQGTTLFIENLRDAWSTAEQRRVYRYVSDILQPFPLKKFKKQQANDVLPTPIAEEGFEVTLIQQTEDGEQVIASQEDTIFANALAIIDGYVDHNGQGIWSVESESLSLSEVGRIGKGSNDNEPFTYLRDISIKTYYYIWRPELFPKVLYTSLHDIGREKGGVKVYRNGFRVSPYGEHGDDWLTLDASTRGRKLLPAHSNINFIGFVELDDPQGKLFEERSSREGLIENEAFRELQDFGYRALTSAVLRVAEARNKKQTAGQSDWRKNDDTSDPAEKIRNVAASLRKAVNEARERKENDSNQESGHNNSSEKGTDNGGKNFNDDDDFKEFDKAADKLEALAENTQQLLQENQLLRVLASLGLVIAEFTHEIKHVVGAAQHSMNVLETLIVNDDIQRQAIEWLTESVNRLQGYSAFFDQTVSETVRRELESQDLRGVGRQFEEAMAASIERMGVDFRFVPDGFELYTPPMHAAEINSLLFNFYSNSLKAIKRAKVRGKMLLRVGEENQMVYLEFSDNGDGIPEANKDRIFNAFFTTGSPAGRSSTVAEEMQGSGLGLKIVADIVHSYRGEVYLPKAPEGYTTCFRVEFPAHSIE